MLSKKELKRAIYEAKSSLSDKDLFTSRSYGDLLTSQKEGMAGFKTGRSKVFVGGKEIAFTDGNEIMLNLESQMTKGLSREERHKVFLGLNLHECGHLLFTDFTLSKERFDAFLSKGELIPLSHPLSKDLEEFFRVGKINVFPLLQAIDNSVEDGFVDRAVCRLTPGYGPCLQFVNERALKTLKMDYTLPVDELRKKGIDEIGILSAMVLNFSRHGEIRGDKSDEIVKYFTEEIAPFISKAVLENDVRERAVLVNEVFVKVIEFAMSKLKDSEKASGGGDSSGEKSSSDGKSSGSQSGDGKSGDSEGKPEDKPEGNSEGSDGKSEGGSSQDSEGNASEGNAGGSLSGLSGDACDKVSSSAKKAGKDLSSSCETKRTNTPVSPTKRMASPSTSVGETSLDKAVNDVAEEKVKEEQEKKIQKDLKEDNGGVNGDFHRGIGYRAVRPEINSDALTLYEQEHKELDNIVRRFISEFEKEIKDRQTGDTLTGLYAGQRFNSSESYRHDKKIFSRDILPEDIPDMAVGILVDCSGSMSRNDKILRAMQSAYITYMFCKRLGIPCFVLGHCESLRQPEVCIFDVADENSLSKKEEQRIFALEARGNNRDGYALKVALNKLLKIPAQDRMLFIISDGQPAGYNYHMSEGRRDCQAVVMEGLKKKVFTVAGAIDDAEQIKTVYTSGISEKSAAEVLDLTDFSRLPKAFVKIIKKRLS